MRGTVDEYQTVDDFDTVNDTSDLNWSLKSNLVKFIKRFITDPYKKEEKEWLEKWAGCNSADIIEKFKALRKIL